MTYELSETEKNGALNLNAEYRYDHFVLKVARSGQLWALKDDDGLLFLTADEGEYCLPVWPHEDYAALWATGDFAGYKPQAITLDIWMEKWIDGLTQDNISIAVFPIHEQENLIVDAVELADSLQKKVEAES